MFRLPPQPLLAPTGYRIPIRGRAPDGPLGPLASRLGYPGAGRGRGKGRGKGRQRNRNRARGGNKKGGAQNQPVIKVEEKTVEVTENTTEEVKDDIIDENWQVISEETEDVDSPQPKTENYVDFHSDMFDTSNAEGFSTFSEPVLVISDEPEVPATAPTEEVTTEDVATEESTVEEPLDKDVVVIADDDTKPADKSQEVTIVYDDVPASNEEPTKEESTPTKEPAKDLEKPSPTITAITAPKPSSPKETKKSNLYGTLHCEVCDVYCYQQKHMKQHLAGRRHRMNVEAQGYSAQKRESKKKERSDSTSKQDGGSAGKDKRMSEAEKKYKAFMKSAATYPGLSDAMQEFFRHKEPLIGLKYGVEVGKSVDDPNPVYYCSICDDYFNSGVKLRHFTGTLHRKTVVKAEFPHKCSDLPKDVGDVEAYRNIAQEIEKEVGKQVHLIRRKVVTTEPISKSGELSTKRKGSDRTVKALLDLPPKDYLLEDPGHGCDPGYGYKGLLLEPHDRVVRVVPPSMKREREMGTWSPPPPAKRQLLDPHERFAADDLNYRSFEGPPSLLSGPSLHLDVGPPRPPLLPSREEPMDSRMFRQGLAPPKPLLSLDLPPIMSGSSMNATLSSFSEQLRRMLDTMDSVPVAELIRSEEDASIALHISNSLTKALLSFRIHSTPNIDHGELGSVYSMFSGSRH